MTGAAVVPAPAAAVAGEAVTIPPAAARAQQPVSGGGTLSPEVAALSPDPQRALELYWTPERMAAAKSADNGLPALPASPAGQLTSVLGKIEVAAGAPRAATGAAGKQRSGAGVQAGSTGTSWPYRHDWTALTNGKVFYTQNGQDGWGCSAVVVTTESASTVFTAGHCVHSGPGGSGWHQNWVFIPDYYNGDRPLGTWSPVVNGLWSLQGWIGGGDWNLDIGAAVIRLNPAGQRLADVTGSQGIRINGPTSANVWSFGFPATPNPPYNGHDLITCDGRATLGVFSSEMEHLYRVRSGASGGAWLADFNGSWGYTVSVYSNFLSNDPLTYYGPYFGDGAYNLYQAVRFIS